MSNCNSCHEGDHEFWERINAQVLEALPPEMRQLLGNHIHTSLEKVLMVKDYLLGDRFHTYEVVHYVPEVCKDEGWPVEVTLTLPPERRRSRQSHIHREYGGAGDTVAEALLIALNEYLFWKNEPDL